eukprot:COSAG01_NODE_50756_length_360_cov_2.003831_1_plen_38_part_10
MASAASRSQRVADLATETRSGAACLGAIDSWSHSSGSS